jgi:hypothetical protein
MEVPVRCNELSNQKAKVQQEGGLGSGKRGT